MDLKTFCFILFLVSNFFRLELLETKTKFEITMVTLRSRPSADEKITMKFCSKRWNEKEVIETKKSNSWQKNE